MTYIVIELFIYFPAIVVFGKDDVCLHDTMPSALRKTQILIVNQPDRNAKCISKSGV
jgi:hypothetical protein